MKRWVAVLAIVSSVFLTTDLAAASSGVVIAQVYPGQSGKATHEYVSIYNNTLSDIDITNWCLLNKKISNNIVACFTVTDSDKLYLPSYSYATIASNDFSLGNLDVLFDEVFTVTSITSGSIIGSNDTIQLVDANHEMVDSLAWTSSVSDGKAWVRLGSLNPEALLDTDRLDDFEATPLVIYDSAVFEVHTVVDVCANMPEIQETMPVDYGFDIAGNCENISDDVCENIPLVQLVVPDGFEVFDGACNESIDVCENIGELQTAVPVGYVESDKNCYYPQIVTVNELLPNAAGADAGHEFIELYNPGNSTVDLTLYRLKIGKDLEQTYEFLPGSSLSPGEYKVWYDNELGFTLLNTTSRVSLEFFDGQQISAVPAYENSVDDNAWVYMNGTWQNSNRPTPGAVNLSSFVDELVNDIDDTPMPITVPVPAPCGEGRYRHPITNRCRNIENDAIMLVACEADEYRNQGTNRCRKTAALAAALLPCSTGYERNAETNRCRKTESSARSLMPCDEGEERNEATNRCRKITGAVAGLSACQDGSERNPATNRCRQSVATPVPSVAAIVPPASQNLLQTSLVAIAGLAAVSYGLYEWRQEAMGALKKVAGIFSRK